MASFSGSPVVDASPNVLLDVPGSLMKAQQVQHNDLTNTALGMENNYTAAVQPGQINMMLQSMAGMNQAALRPSGQPSDTGMGGPQQPSSASAGQDGQPSGQGMSLLTGPTPQSADPETQAAVGREAAAQGVNPDWAQRIHYVESGGARAPFAPGTTSSAGALGPMQLMPGTAKDLGVDPMDATQNIYGGVKYLAQMKQRYGNPVVATAAYNAGPERVDNWLAGKATLPAETVGYVGKVFGSGNGAGLLSDALSGAHGHAVGGVQGNGEGLQVQPTDEASKAAVRELQAQLHFNISLRDGKGARAAAAIQTALDNIAGPGGIALPDGSIGRVPGSFATRFAASNAAEAGKVAPAAQLHAMNDSVTQAGARQTHAANEAVNRAGAQQTHAVNKGVDVAAATLTPVKLGADETLTTPAAVGVGSGAAPNAAPLPASLGAPPAAPVAAPAPSPLPTPTGAQMTAPVAAPAVNPALEDTGSASVPQPASAAQAPGMNPLAIPGPVGAAPINPLAQGNAQPTQPGVYRAPLRGVNPAEIQTQIYKEDRDALVPIQEAGQQAQQAQIKTRAMRDNFAANPSGAGAPTKLMLQNWIQSTFGPSVAADFASKITGMNDVGAAQEAKKFALVTSGTQERGVLGSRGSLGALKLYSDANPGIEMQPTAIRDLSNMQLVAQQMDADYAAGAGQHVRQQGQSLMGNKPYQSLNDYNQQWQGSRPAQVYAAAMSALNGKPYETWGQNLNKDEIKRVVGILSRADPGAEIKGKGGGDYNVPSGQQ